MERVFFDLEMPLVKILAEMELAGVKLDIPLLREALGRLRGAAHRAGTGDLRLAGGEFNINSPQLGETLFVRMGLPTGKKTRGKTGFSTDISVPGRARRRA